MGIITEYASLPNSRQRPRKPTQEADTFIIHIPVDNTIGVIDPSVDPVTSANRGNVTFNGNSILIENNQNRTLLTLRNVHASAYIRYGFVDRPTLNQDGLLLKAGDSVDLESPQVVYVARELNDESGEEIEVDVHFGIG